MIINLTIDEIDEVVACLRMNAHESNRIANTAQSEGYPQDVEREMAQRAASLYSLADSIDDQRRRYKKKPEGSGSNIDPFDTPLGLDTPKTPNDPIEW